MGFALNNSSLINISHFIATPEAIVALGTLIIVLLTPLLLFPVKHYLRYQLGMWVLGILSIIISVALFMSTSPLGFRRIFDADFASYNTTYTGVINQAKSLGFKNPGLLTFGLPTLYATPFMFLSLNGFQMGAYFGGELRNVRKSMVVAGILGGLLSILFYAVVGYTFQHTVGAQFLNALSFIEYAHPSAYVLPIPWSNFFFSMILTKNPLLIILMVVGLFAWGVTGVTAVGLVSSRIMFAAGFDRSLPTLLAKVSERFHTPVTAVTIYMALTELGLVLSVYAGVIFEFLNITLVLVSLYAFV